jgi:hypothetical protein
MSVQTTTPSGLPDRVSTTILGRDVVADVIATDSDADVGRGPWDALLVDVDGSQWWIDATDANAVPPV